MTGLRWERPTLEQAVAQLVELNSLGRCAAAFGTAAKLIEQGIADPARCASIKSQSKTLRARILDLSGGHAFFEAVGFNAGENYVLDASLGEPELRRRLDLVKRACARLEAMITAINAIGDRNPPAAAVAAVKLAHMYATNILAHPSDDSKRRISASNKALASRLLSAAGGAELLAAIGFELQSADDAYVCTAPADEVHVAAGALDKSEAHWAELASAAGVDPSMPAGSSSAGPAGDSRIAEPIPLESIVIAKLPLASSLARRAGNADLEPVLVADEERSAVLLFCWMGVSKRWRQFAKMQTPSTIVEWERPTVEGARYELVIEVDLGDGKALELGYQVVNGEAENEYMAANRFIGQHFESLNSNHLEEIARNVRNRVSPVLQTLKNLVVAMEAQN